MITKRENIVGYIDIEDNKHLCLECFLDSNTDMENVTVMTENQIKEDESCICDKCKRIIW